MKKEDVLLRLIAISGELPAGLVGEIVESESYAAALITRLKKENYISVRNAGGYKGYVLRRKGKRYLLERYEDDLSFFLSGSAQTNHVKSEPEKRLRLYRMSEVWVFLWKMGIEIFQSQKPDLGNGFEKSGKKAVYYGSLEYKESAEAINVSLMGAPAAAGKVKELSEHAVELLNSLDRKNEFLDLLVESLISRRK